MANNTIDNEKLNGIVTDCNEIQAIATTLNTGLRTCITDLSTKIQEDNYGTRSNKDGALSSLIDSVGVLGELEDFANLIMDAINQSVN